MRTTLSFTLCRYKMASENRYVTLVTGFRMQVYGQNLMFSKIVHCQVCALSTSPKTVLYCLSYFTLIHSALCNQFLNFTLNNPPFFSTTLHWPQARLWEQTSAARRWGHLIGTPTWSWHGRRGNSVVSWWRV